MSAVEEEQQQQPEQHTDPAPADEAPQNDDAAPAEEQPAAEDEAAAAEAEAEPEDNTPKPRNHDIRKKAAELRDVLAARREALVAAQQAVTDRRAKADISAETKAVKNTERETAALNAEKEEQLDALNERLRRATVLEARLQRMFRFVQRSSSWVDTTLPAEIKVGIAAHRSKCDQDIAVQVEAVNGMRAEQLEFIAGQRSAFNENNTMFTQQHEEDTRKKTRGFEEQRVDRGHVRGTSPIRVKDMEPDAEAKMKQYKEHVKDTKHVLDLMHQRTQVMRKEKQAAAVKIVGIRKKTQTEVQALERELSNRLSSTRESFRRVTELEHQNSCTVQTMQFLIATLKQTKTPTTATIEEPKAATKKNQQQIEDKPEGEEEPAAAPADEEEPVDAAGEEGAVAEADDSTEPAAAPAEEEAVEADA
jgi:hypothetical protein